MPAYLPDRMNWNGNGNVDFNIGMKNPGDNNTYLPGGDWANGGKNHPPDKTNAFVFLRVKADMSAVYGGVSPDYRNVYVPCYFPWNGP
jgi:hypothetical protein